MVARHGLALGLAAMIAGLAGLAGPALAQDAPLDLLDIAPPRLGASACFARDYDAAHLGANPTQRTLSVRLLVTVERVPGEASRIDGVARILLTRRGENVPVRLSGDGCTYGREANRANGGGRVIDTHRRDDGILCWMVGPHLDAEGDHILLAPMAGGILLHVAPSLFAVTAADPTGARRRATTFGAADRVFRLERAPDEACRDARAIPGRRD